MKSYTARYHTPLGRTSEPTNMGDIKYMTNVNGKFVRGRVVCGVLILRVTWYAILLLYGSGQMAYVLVWIRREIRPRVCGVWCVNLACYQVYDIVHICVYIPGSGQIDGLRTRLDSSAAGGLLKKSYTNYYGIFFFYGSQKLRTETFVAGSHRSSIPRGLFGGRKKSNAHQGVHIRHAPKKILYIYIYVIYTAEGNLC